MPVTKTRPLSGTKRTLGARGSHFRESETEVAGGATIAPEEYKAKLSDRGRRAFGRMVEQDLARRGVQTYEGSRSWSAAEERVISGAIEKQVNFDEVFEDAPSYEVPESGESASVEPDYDSNWGAPDVEPKTRR